MRRGSSDLGEGEGGVGGGVEGIVRTGMGQRRAGGGGGQFCRASINVKGAAVCIRRSYIPLRPLRRAGVAMDTMLSRRFRTSWSSASTWSFSRSTSCRSW